MSEFTSSSLALEQTDARKRVHYTFGLVLGADEFVQEQSYFLGKHRRHNQWLHGYGTIDGLKVNEGLGGDANLEIQVTPGTAISPSGHEICVPRLMCVRLNDWLARHRTALDAIFGPLPGTVLELCVVACYRECETDVLPVPGEPCRRQTDAMAASRLADAFELKLCLNQTRPTPLSSDPAAADANDGLCRYRPSEREEEGVRLFGLFLERLTIGDGSNPFVTEEDLLAAVRNIGTSSSSSSSASSSSLSSAPSDLYFLPASAADDMMRAVFRTWVTEVRPRFLETECPCALPRERCVLLAEVSVPVIDWQVSGTVNIDERNRAFLLSTRVLQEWLQNGLGNGQTIVSSGGGVTDHGALSGLGDDDHLLYLRADGVRPLTGNLDANGRTIVNLPLAGADGQPVVRQQAVKVNDPAGGDLGATYPNPSVVALAGRPLAPITADPVLNSALTWDVDNRAWAPQPAVLAPATSAGDPLFVVAAGFFTLDAAGVPQPNQPLHNNLRARVVSPLVFAFTWTRGLPYRRPSAASRHTYVVKAIAVSRRGGINVTCMGMIDDGIVVAMFPVGEAVTEGSGLMIEITQIGVQA